MYLGLHRQPGVYWCLCWWVVLRSLLMQWFEHCYETKRHLQRPPLSAVRSTPIKPPMLAKGGSRGRRKKYTSPIFSDLTFGAQRKKQKLRKNTLKYNQLKTNKINNSNLNLKGRNLDLNNQLHSNSVPVLPIRKDSSPYLDAGRFETE